MDKVYMSHLLLLMWFWVLVGIIVIKLGVLAFGEFPIERKPIERHETVLTLIINWIFMAALVYALWS